MRLNTSKGILALVDKVQSLSVSHGSESTASLLRECGINDDEIVTFTTFTPRLGHHRNRIDKQSLGYDAIRALVHFDQESVAQALTFAEAGGCIGVEEIRRLKEISEGVKVSDLEMQSISRDECFKAECLRLAEERQFLFTGMAVQLHANLDEYDQHLQYVRGYYEAIEDYEFLETLSEDDIEDLRKEGAEVRSLEEAFFSEKEQEIVAGAKELLKEFDQIFPGRAIPKSDWALVGIDNPTLRKFAEAREALCALQVGGFLSGFPGNASPNDQWDAVASIAYLAGITRGKRASTKFLPRPVKKLNAFIVRSGSGVEAVGLDAAGFRVWGTYTFDSPGRPRGETLISAGRPKVVVDEGSLDPPMDIELSELVKSGQQKIEIRPNAWNIKPFQIDHEIIRSDLQNEIGKLGGADVHLLAGTLQDQAFKERGKGEFDPREQFKHAFRLLQDIKPKAFFFECAAEFLGSMHTPLRDRLTKHAEELGFAVTSFELNASSFGVPQDRARSVFIGVSAEFASRLRPPVLLKPTNHTIGDVIKDVAFGYLPGILAIPKELRTPGQVKYRKWALTWLAKYRKTSVCDTLSLIRKSSGAFDKWYQQGFNINEQHTRRPVVEELHTESVPLSLQILKRLQGIPDDWEFVGSNTAQIEQICETTPPVIYRVIGHIIHAAITGEDVDIDQAARTKFDLKRWKTASGFRSMTEGCNPTMGKAMEWREYILGEEAGT